MCPTRRKLGILNKPATAHTISISFRCVGCQIGRLEYEEGDVMRLRQFHWNNSLLWERKCRCGSGGVTGRNMMQGDRLG